MSASEPWIADLSPNVSKRDAASGDLDVAVLSCTLNPKYVLLDRLVSWAHRTSLMIAAQGTGGQMGGVRLGAMCWALLKELGSSWRLYHAPLSPRPKP